jgi:hypothetical protein
MVTGTAMMAFHNLLSLHYEAEGVGCTETDFLPELRILLGSEGRNHAWNEYKSNMHFRACGSSKLKWDKTPILVIQAFWGPLEAGHYTTLILDRTHKGQPPRAVYADSLPGYQENACYILRDVLQFCPELGTDNAEWIEAQVPRQGMGSNDCGLFTATFAARDKI